MNNNTLKRLLPYGVAIIIFIAITLLYCYPMLQGKVINQMDMKNWEAMAHETLEFNKSSDIPTYWTNSLFSGMPTYQIYVDATSAKIMKVPGEFLHLFLPSVLGLIIGYFIGFFILLRSFGINKWISIVGAIAIAFSSYFFIILATGHNTKAATIGYMAPVIAGFFLIFRKKYFWGIPLVMLYSAVGIMQHPQMSYYIFLMLGILGIAELYLHIKDKKVKDFFVGILLFAVSVGIGVGTRYSVTRANSEYLKETMRGNHSELSANSEKSTSESSGLSLKYATQWSYGIGETMTLLIPNFQGGSSNYNLGENSGLYKELVNNGIPRNTAKEFVSGLPMYWGDQPFTSGPVYIGAIVCFLFVLGIFIVKGPYKWALLVATLFSIMLSWGSNFMGLTEFFFQYFPMYNKFRAVSSILVVAEITMPLLGFLAIKAIMDKDIPKEKKLNSIYCSAGITAGICLILALIGGSLFSFSGISDNEIFSQLPEWISGSIISERVSMLRSDSFRSFVFIILSALLLWLYIKNKVKLGIFASVLGILILIDMWPVNKRYFGDEYFITKKQNDKYFEKLPYEEELLKDSDPNFRVLNLTTNTFNDARTSYYLKSIGGYHGAKLRRYQDIIDEHIVKNNPNVINMLNTKYFITRGQSGQAVAQHNPHSMGNAWFIDTMLIAENPDEESAALYDIDIKTTAVTDKQFAGLVISNTTDIDTTAYINLTSYAPNSLEYNSFSSKDKTAVFSEIYYPYGWKAYIDDNPVEYFRVNYILRAINIPAGEHNIRFEFRPDSIYKGEKVSYIFIIILFSAIALCIAYPVYKNVKKQKVK